MADSDKVQAPAWTVISNQPASGPVGNGTYGPGHQITARLESGSTFTVFVPNSDLTSVDRVRGIIAARAALVDGIDRLTGP